MELTHVCNKNYLFTCGHDQKSKGAQSNAAAAPKYPFDLKALLAGGGLGDLDAHLADRTYVMGGHEATAADAVAFEALSRSDIIFLKHGSSIFRQSSSIFSMFMKEPSQFFMS